MAFELYPWLVAEWHQLNHLHRGGRLPHALILAGQPGIGKAALAERLSATLLCDKPSSDDFSPCGHCRSCQQLQAHSHPDYHRIERLESAQEISVAQIRKLVAFVAMKAQYSGRRVVVIQQAERMNLSAANALLKSLEEPSDGAHILLVCDHPQQLLPTIRSRCQQLMCRAGVTHEAILWLERQLTAELDARTLLTLSDGAPLKALELADPQLLSKREQLFMLLEQLSQGKADLYEASEQWHSFTPDYLYTWLYYACTDLMRLSAGASTTGLRNPDQIGRFQPMAEQVNLAQLDHLLREVERALFLQRSQVNNQLLLEGVLIAWVQAWHPVPHASIEGFAQ